jgi:hypothetical protein
MTNLQDLVNNGSETVVSYNGGDTLPPLPNNTITGIVLADGVGTAAHGPLVLTPNYDSGISNDAPASPAAQSWVVASNANNDTVMVGAGGGQVVNFGVNTQIFMTGQSVGSVPSPQIIDQIALLDAPAAPSATAWVDGNATLNGSGGSTTLHLSTITGAATVIAGLPIPAPLQYASAIVVNNNGTGANTIDIDTNTTSLTGASTTTGTVPAIQADFITLNGNSSIAATVNAGGSAGTNGGTVPAGVQQAEVVAFILGSAQGLFNAGAANVVLFGAGNAGSATLFGGTGTDINAGAGGLIEAGTGGNSQLYGSFNQATTLVGGSSTDLLASVQKNTTLIAGAGSETLASFNQGAVLMGFGVSTLIGQGSPGASATNMIGEIGGNSFQIGAGATQVQANNFGSNLYEEGFSSANGLATITGFNVGTDTISLSNPAGGTYALNSSGPAGLTFTTGGGSTMVHFGDGTTWTVVGATLTNTNFG